jgi:uncharacterized protein DUF6491
LKEVDVRAVMLLVAGAALASCSTAPPLPTRTAAGQRQFEQLVAGKVAGAPLKCLHSFNQNDMIVIDEQTIAYRQGSNRVFINHLEQSCPGLGSPSTALVTRSIGTSDTCRGDFARVLDTSSRMVVGSCVFGDFIPYTKSG